MLVCDMLCMCVRARTCGNASSYVFVYKWKKWRGRECVHLCACVDVWNKIIVLRAYKSRSTGQTPKPLFLRNDFVTHDRRNCFGDRPCPEFDINNQDSGDSSLVTSKWASAMTDCGFPPMWWSFVCRTISFAVICRSVSVILLIIRTYSWSLFPHFFLFKEFLL